MRSDDVSMSEAFSVFVLSFLILCIEYDVYAEKNGKSMREC